jgi:hypothetical protein
MNQKSFPIFALLLALIGINAVSLQAQTRRKVTLDALVPFEFVIGNRVFPAGHYTFEMATGVPKVSDQSGVLVVRGSERQLYAAVATGVTADTNAHVNPKLIFVRSGDRNLLSKVWRQGDVAGLSVHTVPATSQAEGEESEVFTLDAVITTGIL